MPIGILGGILGSIGGAIGKIFDDGHPAQDLEPLIDAEPGFLQKANQFLGSNVGKITTEIGGGLLSDARSQRNTRQQFDFLKKQGLDPVEIAGGGGGSSATPAQGNTLGSGPATQLLSQQEFTRRENDKQRANDLAIAKVQADAPLQRVGLEKERQPFELAKLEQDTFLSAKQFDLIDKQMRALDREHENFWAIKLATMSPENVLAALLMASEGIDAGKVLRQENGSPDEIAAVEAAIKRIIQTKSKTWIESQGLAGLTEEMMRNIGSGINTLSNTKLIHDTAARAEKLRGFK